MKIIGGRALLGAALSLTLAAAPTSFGAASAEMAGAVKEKIQSLRNGCAQGRNQVTQTLEELNRLLAPGVELRPQFERFTAELAKLEGMTATARERAAEMKEKGHKFFADWEEQIKSIQNEDIRKEAAGRMAKRQKSYGRIISEMQDAREELGPFMSDLNDIKTLLDSELTAGSVASSRTLIKKANWHGGDVKDALSDVEKELDRMTAELATYQ